MKKRLIIAALLIVVLAALSVFAHADGPVNPYREEVLRNERRILEERAAAGFCNASGYFSGSDYITLRGTKKPCQKLTFTAKLANTGYSADDLVFKWTILDIGRSAGTIFSHNYDTGTGTLDYYFYSAGTYCVQYYAFPKEYENNEYWVRFTVVKGYVEFTIPEDGVHPTLEQKAQEIVSECKGPTQWDTALNLYEWLTGHCDYDYDYHLYGPDILFSGSGVCDAFSKAYMLLLNTAGIPADRAFSPTHAWNVLKLGGKWYQADPTWDDSGTHDFFCLSAKAMIPVSSHSYEDRTQGGAHVTECTSMDANYYIHTGKWREFGVSQYDENYDSHWVSCMDQARAELAKGNTGFTVECWKQDDEWSSSSAFRYPSIAGAVIEAGLQGDGLFFGDDRVTLRAEAADSVYIDVTISGWDIRETGTLTLPRSVKAVANEAYAGTGATTVVIPAGCTSIGAGAFRGSQVRKIFIPSSVTSISASAFDGCGKIIFVTDSAAAVSYAAEHGMLVVRP